MRVRIYRREHFPQDQWYRNSYGRLEDAMTDKCRLLSAVTVGSIDVYQVSRDTSRWILKIEP